MSRVEVEDKLSVLPDDVLIDILSRLEIHNAASTSVLSHRWRYLWTGVTRFQFCHHCSSQEKYRTTESVLKAATTPNIVRQLTAAKLEVFKVRLDILLSSCAPDIINESSFRQLHAKRVEQITLESANEFGDFRVPVCLFEIESLVILELLCISRLPKNVGAIQFPNLKKLCLGTLANVPNWLATPLFISSCPLLEDLSLIFGLQYTDQCFELHILCPNLKSLRIHDKSGMYYHFRTPYGKIFIDAPALTELEVVDTSFRLYLYCVQKPTRLMNARIDSSTGFCGDDCWKCWRRDVGEGYGYVHHISEFIAAISSVRKLDLILKQQRSNVLYTRLSYYLKDGPMTVTLPELTHLSTTLWVNGLKGWKELVHSLHCFPNLKHLTVNTDSKWDYSDYLKNWCAPDNVPYCVVSKLEKIEISMCLRMSDNELVLLSYILSNAMFLETLSVSYIGDQSREDRVRNAIIEFCRSLFKLPRGSSTCEIVFASPYFTASSNDFKDGVLMGYNIGTVLKVMIQ